MSSELEGNGVERPEKKEPKIINKGEETIEPTAKLMRFLYIGNDKNVFISHRDVPISFDDLDDRLGFIKDMAALRFNLAFGVIKKVMLSDTLRRNNEAFLAIAYCLRRVDNIGAEEMVKMKADIYQGLPELLKTDSDLFLFVSFCKKVSNSNFGRGMRKALSQWYRMRTAEELADMFGRNRGMHGWTHQDIIRMCHVKFGSIEENDKAQLIATLFKSGTQTITDLKALRTTKPDDMWPPAIRRIFHICSLKVNESAGDAAEMIQLHNFDLQQLPVHLVTQHEVWDVLIPKMKYGDLLKVFQMLHAMNMLKANDPLAKKMSLSLGNNNLIKSSKTHPWEIFAVLKLYEKNQRYNESINDSWYQKKKVKKLDLVPNPNIIKRLFIAVNHALNNSPQTGCDFCITLNLRESAKRHHVFRMSQVTCLDAMVMFALAFRKREKNTKIYTFVQDENSMAPVKLTTDMTFEKALTHCESLLMRTTRPKLSLPFKYADKNNKNTIFLTIVDSVARFCNDGEAPIDQFRAYRKIHSHSKFIVLNLRKNHGDLQFTYEKGFLEICGLTPDTWKIIHSFATNSFA